MINSKRLNFVCVDKRCKSLMFDWQYPISAVLNNICFKVGKNIFFLCLIGSWPLNNEIKHFNDFSIHFSMNRKNDLPFTAPFFIIISAVAIVISVAVTVDVVAMVVVVTVVVTPPTIHVIFYFYFQDILTEIDLKDNFEQLRWKLILMSNPVLM